MTKPISVKELRTKLPKIAKSLESGEEFLLIRRSKPIAQILPVKPEEKKTKNPLLDILVKPPTDALIRSKKSAVQLVRLERSNK
ncbi:MAG: hypothetical protein Q8O75_04155 [bacterium]|nr:hypothetical protein [bacterium]